MLTKYILDAGPIQYDAAVDPEIAKQKIKTPSEVAGQANVCIFPDLNTGNNTYKVSAFLRAAAFCISLAVMFSECMQCRLLPNVSGVLLHEIVSAAEAMLTDLSGRRNSNLCMQPCKISPVVTITQK